MKKIIFSILILSIIISCKQETVKEPSTLEEFNAALSAKKKDLSKLEEEISKLTDKVAELDPTLQEKSKLVDTSIINFSNFTRYIEIQGSVSADDPVNAVSEIAGRISRLYVKEGDVVRRGKLIARIDVESMQKQIDEINSSLELAQDIYQRQERLWQQKIGSEVQYLQAKNNVERLEKSLETINFQMTKAGVYAPISGTVDMVMTRQGEVTSPGMPIIQILNTSKLKVTTDLPENYLKIVKKGQRVDLSFPSLDIETTGKISLLGRKIDPANRTLELEITPAKTSSLLKPNVLSEISIKELEVNNVLMMPLEYILQEVDGTEFIFVSTTDEQGNYRAKKKYVTLGETTKGQVIITDGVSQGEAIIFKGSRNISDGELLEFSK